jgi:hypothetical protein
VIPESTLIGLAAMEAGIVAMNRARVKSRMGLAGILLGVLAFLGGFPLLFILSKIFIP